MGNDNNAILEDSEVVVQMESFKNGRNKPRLSFIPSLMPSIEKSETSPTVQMTSTHHILNEASCDISPGGGAAVVSVKGNKNTKCNDNNKENNTYSPSELFTLVGKTSPNKRIKYKYDYSNKNKSEITRKRSSGIYNNGLPLYVTHKKRKSKSKRKSTSKQPISESY